jgi:hypothetical protein
VLVGHVAIERLKEVHAKTHPAKRSPDKDCAPLSP